MWYFRSMQFNFGEKGCYFIRLNTLIPFFDLSIFYMMFSMIFIVVECSLFISVIDVSRWTQWHRGEIKHWMSNVRISLEPTSFIIDHKCCTRNRCAQWDHLPDGVKQWKTLSLQVSFSFSISLYVQYDSLYLGLPHSPPLFSLSVSK